MYKVLVVDDHPLYRSALRSVLREAFDDVAVEECADLASALAQLAAAPANLVLLDLAIPGVRGLEGVRELRSASPTCPLVVCSANEDPALMREAFRLGVSGYLPKSSGSAIMLHAIQLVRDGGVYVPSEALIAEPAADAGAAGAPGEDAGVAGPGGLTPRQQSVLALLEQGLSNKAIARELEIGEITVKAHVSAILRKLGVENRVQAVLVAKELKH
jgi:DNA-binding NarL/FixJ family response regulator